MKQKYKKIDIKTKRLVNSLFLWNYKAAFKWRGIEFSDFREYTSWDDSKYIDWLVSAREGKTIMRRYREERELDILFVADLSDSMYFGFQQKKIDTLMEVLYLIAFSGVKNGDKVGALIFGWKKDRFLSFKKWNIWLFQILDGIEKYKWASGKEILNLSNLNALPIKNTLTFIITDKIAVDEGSLRLARIKNDIVLINIFDSFENTLEGKWVISLWDESRRIAIDLDNKKKKEKYLKKRNEKKDQFQKILSQNKISRIEIDEKTDIYKAFLGFMKSREL